MTQRLSLGLCDSGEGWEVGEGGSKERIYLYIYG